MPSRQFTTRRPITASYPCPVSVLLQPSELPYPQPCEEDHQFRRFIQWDERPLHHALVKRRGTSCFGHVGNCLKPIFLRLQLRIDVALLEMSRIHVAMFHRNILHSFVFSYRICLFLPYPPTLSSQHTLVHLESFISYYNQTPEAIEQLLGT